MVEYRESIYYNEGALSKRHGGIAQLVRVPASHAGGRRFESSCLYHSHRLFLFAKLLFANRFFIPASFHHYYISLYYRQSAANTVRDNNIADSVLFMFMQRTQAMLSPFIDFKIKL